MSADIVSQVLSRCREQGSPENLAAHLKKQNYRSIIDDGDISLAKDKYLGSHQKWLEALYKPGSRKILAVENKERTICLSKSEIRGAIYHYVSSVVKSVEDEISSKSEKQRISSDTHSISVAVGRALELTPFDEIMAYFKTNIISTISKLSNITEDHNISTAIRNIMLPVLHTRGSQVTNFWLEQIGAISTYLGNVAHPIALSHICNQAEEIIRSLLLKYKITETTEWDDSTLKELQAAVSGTWVEIIRRMSSLSALMGASVKTLFHRWNTLSGYLGIGKRFGGWSTFLRRRILSVRGKRALGGFRPGFLLMPKWENGFLDYGNAIPHNRAWAAGWINRVPYPVSPIDILWLAQDWLSIWGFLRPPITFHIVDEVSAMVSTNSNRFVSLLGDDQFKAIPKRAMLIEYTPYTCLLLSVLCQHSNVDELPIFR
ncbi:hypothetical protein GJ496_000528 [Pomphorhynchus laevis]|nr:hypothetical protein GJ496_000528 [Pomphorhynchus laevis]